MSHYCCPSWTHEHFRNHIVWRRRRCWSECWSTWGQGAWSSARAGTLVPTEFASCRTWSWAPRRSHTPRVCWRDWFPSAQGRCRRTARAVHSRRTWRSFDARVVCTFGSHSKHTKIKPQLYFTYLYDFEFLLVNACYVGDHFKLLYCQESVLVHPYSRIDYTWASMTYNLSLTPSDYITIFNRFFRLWSLRSLTKESSHHVKTSNLLGLLILIIVRLWAIMLPLRLTRAIGHFTLSTWVLFRVALTSLKTWHWHKALTMVLRCVAWL